jgi:hypothetical protein
MGQHLYGRSLHWAVTAASCQAFLLLGYDQGVMSGLVGADNQFGTQMGHPDANMQGICTSCAFETRPKALTDLPL